MVRHPATRHHPPARAAGGPQSPTQPRPRSRPGPLRIRQDLRRRSRRHLVAHGTRPSHRHHHPTITAIPKQHTTPSFPSFAIIRILVQTSTQRPKFTATTPTTLPPSPQHPLPQQPSPLPRAITPPPPRGRLRGGLRVRATGRPRGAPPPPKPPTPTIHRNTPLPHHSILPIISNLSHHSSGVSQNTPISKYPYSASFPHFPTQHLTAYRDTSVLAFSLYKLVSDRRIWTPIKPELDEGITGTAFDRHLRTRAKSSTPSMIYVGGESRPALFASSSRRRQHLPTPPRHRVAGLHWVVLFWLREKRSSQHRTDRGVRCRRRITNQTAQPEPVRVGR